VTRVSRETPKVDIVFLVVVVLLLLFRLGSERHSLVIPTS
jgi:hypothetical protein